VFALFRANIQIIDATKRTILSRLLLESVLSSTPGEKLDEKLATLRLPSDLVELPPPSSDEMAWWDKPEHPNGVFLIPAQSLNHRRSTNPFDSPEDSSLSSSPSSSDEELYTHALALQTPIIPVLTKRKPPPPPPKVNRLDDGTDK
jgi:hypothetical protein